MIIASLELKFVVHAQTVLNNSDQWRWFDAVLVGCNIRSGVSHKASTVVMPVGEAMEETEGASSVTRPKPRRLAPQSPGAESTTQISNLFHRAKRNAQQSKQAPTQIGLGHVGKVNNPKATLYLEQL